MNSPTRMSPLTAFFCGLFGVGAVGIGAGTIITLYGMRIVDGKATAALTLVEDTVGNLPALIESLPPVFKTVLNDRRAPDYLTHVDVQVEFATGRSGGSHPVLTIKNNGGEVISLLAVNVTALNDRNVPVRDWTAVVATPLAIDEDWRGPILPGSIRRMVLSNQGSIPAEWTSGLKGECEVSDVRIWQPIETVAHSN